MRFAHVLAFGLLAVFGVLAIAKAVLLQPALPPEPALSATPARGTLPWGGLARGFLAYVPAEVAVRPALVLVFHGSQGDAAQARAGFGFEWDRLADQHGFVVLYPEGYEGHWNDCRRAGPYAANRLGVDDVGFTRALAARVVESHGADPGRVFATGISNGGQMALRLALEAPDLVRAAAPVLASLPTEENLDCTPSGEPVSILLMNGTEDPMNPYQGGTVALYGLFGDRGEVLSTPATAEYFARLAGHEGPGLRDALPDRDARDGSTIERTRWPASGRKDVALYTVVGGGHTVPHPEVRFPRLLGRTNADVAAAREIWAFFEAAP